MTRSGLRRPWRLRDSDLRLRKLLREQAGVRCERGEITRTKMKLPERPGVSQRHNGQTEVPRIFGGSLRYDGDPDTRPNQHCDVLNPSELNEADDEY
jgi:hypothetical protein